MADWWRDDPVSNLLIERRLGADFERLQTGFSEAGKRCAEELEALSRAADRHRPLIVRTEQEGRPVDRLEYHSSYAEIRRISRELGIISSAYGESREPRIVSFALGYIFAQAECGYYCPICLTDGTAFILERHAPELATKYLSLLTSTDVENCMEGAMWLTEREGGSDVGGGIRTRADPAEDGMWRLSGEKWFASNADADLALTLARPYPEIEGTAGLGLYLIPRRLADGRTNNIHFTSLKDKLGVASMATAEIVLERALAWQIKPAGEGFRAMADMLNISRLYNSVASIAAARRSVRLASEEGLRREAFGSLLRGHALWRRRILDLACVSHSATALVLQACHMMDEAEKDETQAKALRALTPVIKAVAGKIAVEAASEACEALGGNGYIEDYPAARILRDAQVLPIWEGTTNILSLDLLRAVREGAVAALLGLAGGWAASPDSDGDAGRLGRRVRILIEHVELRVERLQEMNRDECEASSWDLVREIYDACSLAVVSGDAAWANTRGENHLEVLAGRCLARPELMRADWRGVEFDDALPLGDDVGIYAKLVEGR